MVNQNSTLTSKNDDDRHLAWNNQGKENLDNAEVDPKTVPPNGLKAPVSISSQHVQDEHSAKTEREIQYRALYLRAKEDYEKLSRSYLKLKESYAASKNAFRLQEMYINDLSYKINKNGVNMDTTTVENTPYSEIPRPSSLNLLLSSFSHPTSEVSNTSLLPLAEPRQEDQALNRGIGIKNTAEEKILKDNKQIRDPADQAVRKLTALQEQLVKQELAKFTQNTSARECPSENDSDEQKNLKDNKQIRDPADQANRKLTPQQELQVKHELAKFTQNISARECLSENDSDEPIIISERSLKRKRPGSKQHNASNAAKDTNVSNDRLANPLRLKSEPEFSSPHSTVAHQSLVKPNDSIDLDDVGDRTFTPRKRRRVWACQSGEEDIRCTREDEGGVRLLAEVATHTKYPPSPTTRIRYHSRTPDSPLKSHIFRQNRTCNPESTSGQTRRDVLGVLDPNRRMLPNSNDPMPNQQWAVQPSQNSHDGTFDMNYGPPGLDEIYRVTESKWSAKGAAILRDYDDEMNTERPNLPPLSSLFEMGRKDEKRGSVIEALEPPVSRLYPEDFKLNPQRNHGLSYAYSEVIRGQDARKCLNGCTRPGCCGTLLRKAIEIGGYISSPKPRLCSAFNNTNNEDEAEEDKDKSQDQQLLDEYLGTVEHRLKPMSEADRKELLLQAQTEKFAKQYGKHRTSGTGGGIYGGRASTPPGFWNADMPTTQEEIENRKCANEMERRKVEMMYREAMRPNGQYLLR